MVWNSKVKLWLSISSYFLKIFKVTGKSKDGTIEAIEGLDTNHFIVGVQFHPELEKQNNILFKRLVKEARKK